MSVEVFGEKRAALPTGIVGLPTDFRNAWRSGRPGNGLLLQSRLLGKFTCSVEYACRPTKA